MCDLLSKIPIFNHFKYQFDGLVQDYSISIANALEILQSYTKPSNFPLNA